MPQPHEVTTSAADFVYFADRALSGMQAVLGELGDDLANTRPQLRGANTAFGLATHCLGVIDYWAGQVVAGREVHRDRAAEFDAEGGVQALIADLERAKTRLASDLAATDTSAVPLGSPDPAMLGPDRELDRGGVLMHLLEELAQHQGQLQIIRDVLLASTPPVEEPVAAFEPPMSWLRTKRGVKWSRPGPGVLPAWVADMDFPVAPVIRTAMVEAIDRGDLGYPDWFDGQHPLQEVFAHRMQQRFGWHAEPDHVRGVTDIIQALQLVLALTTAPGDGVVLQEPNYPPFRRSVPTMGRRVVALAVVADGDSWRHDLDRLDRTLRQDPGARVLLLVNPHNPTGHSFSRDELQAVAELAARHDLIVVSDEIHADLVYAPARHIPFASLDPSVAARTVTVTSATKAFNIAGVRTAIAHIGPPELRQRWDAEPPDIHGATSSLGIAATAAAWTRGDDWLAEANTQLRRRRDQLMTGFANTPGLQLRTPEATYLAWLDWSEAMLGTSAADFFLREAGVYTSPGPDYGGTQAFLRLNFATSTELLDQIVERMVAANSRRSPQRG